MTESCKSNFRSAEKSLMRQLENVVSFNNCKVKQIHPSMPVYQVQGEKVCNLSFIYTGEGLGDDFGQWLVIFPTMNNDCISEAITMFNRYLAHNDLGYPQIGLSTVAGVILNSGCIKDSHTGLMALKEINGGSLPIYISPGPLGLMVSKHLPDENKPKSGTDYRVFGNIRISFRKS